MAGWPRHQFQVLTKRPENILPVLKKCGNRERFPDNVWIGATVEDARVRERIDFVRWFPARIKFLSVEPLIAPLLAVDFSGIDWVITGGESGPGARYMDADWVREVHDLCRKYGAKHFFKQYGQVKNNPLYKQAIDGISGAVWVKRNDPIGKGGSKLDGVYIKEMPDGFEVPAFDEAFTDDKFKAT
jgi:protein gp37